MMSQANQQQALSPALRAVMTRTVDPNCGLLTTILEEPPLRQGAGIRIVRTKVTPPAYFRGNKPSPVKTVEDGCGAAFDRETAYWAAIGEAVERYAGSIYWPDDMMVGAADAMTTQVMDVRALIRIGRPEVSTFDPSTPRLWTQGVELGRGQPVLVPAALCFLGYRSSYPGEILSQSDSTGLACASSFSDGCLRGLMEVIERDVFSANWLLGRVPPALSFAQADLDQFTGPVRHAITSADLPLRFFHLAKAFGVHVVVSFVRDERGMCSIGAAASTSLKRAVEKATAEVLQGWSAINKFPHLEEPITVEELKTPFDHLRYYMHQERVDILDAYFAGSTSVAFAVQAEDDDIAPTLGGIVAALAVDGFQPVAVDQTTDDVAELGFKVVRVIVPGLQPLVFGPHCVEVPDTRRIDQWRQTWQLRQMPLQLHPHPFP